MVCAPAAETRYLRVVVFARDGGGWTAGIRERKSFLSSSFWHCASGCKAIEGVAYKYGMYVEVLSRLPFFFPLPHLCLFFFTEGGGGGGGEDSSGRYCSLRATSKMNWKI